MKNSGGLEMVGLAFQECFKVQYKTECPMKIVSSISEDTVAIVQESKIEHAFFLYEQQLMRDAMADISSRWKQTNDQTGRKLE